MDDYYYRHTILNLHGTERPVTVPISMSETLTLRDQFAMAAISSGKITGQTYSVARQAYENADAMLEARKEKK